MRNIRYLVILAALSACGEPTRRPPAAPGDGGPKADAVADAGFWDAAPGPDLGPFDGNSLRDAATADGSGDESIRGTTLEGIQIAWEAPVQLCTAWREGRTVAEERADKAQITLLPAPRPSLGSGHLSQLQLGGGKIRRGPFADQQVTFGAQPGALVSYRLTTISGAQAVNAEIEYDLGPLGVLIETYQVYRSQGQTDPVRLNDHRFEHFFALQRGIPENTVLLEPCAGPENLDNAISVLVGEIDGQYLTLTRFARTVEPNAGSAPMFLRGMTVWFSELPYEQFSAWGYWPMTYAAEHHNFDDTTHLDFSQDLGWYHTLFKPWSQGQAPNAPEVLETLDLRGIDGFEVPPQIELTFRNTTNNTRHPQVWSAQRQWLRVDSQYWLNRLEGTCEGPEVWSLAGFSAALQVLVCPQAAAPGFRIEGVVPVAFAPDPTQIGQNHDTVAPTTESGRPGYRVQVGQHEISITRGDGQYLWVIVRQGSTVVDEFLGEPGDFWLLPRQEVLRYGADNGNIRLTITRQFVRIGVGESAIYAPVQVEIQALGRTWQVEAWDQMDYVNTHHNWNDRLTARAPDATFEWATEFLPKMQNTLRILDNNGDEILPLTSLEILR